MPTTSLEDLQHQIAQREQELERLRQELQARQSRLSELAHHKEDLENKLRQVDEEIAAWVLQHLQLPSHPSQYLRPHVPPLLAGRGPRHHLQPRLANQGQQTNSRPYVKW
jgi:hypothetical protein